MLANSFRPADRFLLQVGCDRRDGNSLCPTSTHNGAEITHDFVPSDRFQQAIAQGAFQEGDESARPDRHASGAGNDWKFGIEAGPLS
jgi:hypothetical protein